MLLLLTHLPWDKDHATAETPFSPRSHPVLNLPLIPCRALPAERLAADDTMRPPLTPKLLLMSSSPLPCTCALRAAYRACELKGV